MPRGIIEKTIEGIKNFLVKAKKPLIIILGPTASGKTQLSLQIARAINGEIISADSRQVYKQMDIGTDLLLPEKQESVPHHMLGFLDPNHYFSLADYKYKANKVIKEIYTRQNIPMLVGGTGLYINAIAEDYNIPKSEPNFKLRNKLQQEYEQFGAEYLHQKLSQIDPNAAQKIHPNNTRYLIRALEINHETKSNKTNQRGNCGYDTFFLGLEWDREILYERINRRVDNQIKRGLVSEVKALTHKMTNANAPAFSSLGCKEIIEYLKGNITLEQATELIKKNTRNYAKRQLTWFRRNQNINWVDGQKIEEAMQSLPNT